MTGLGDVVIYTDQMGRERAAIVTDAGAPQSLTVFEPGGEPWPVLAHMDVVTFRRGSWRPRSPVAGGRAGPPGSRQPPAL